MPKGTEYDGPFSFDMAPHVRGVLEAWDDPEIRVIILCWGTRMMKTSTMVSLLIFAAVFAPRPMAFGAPDREVADRDITDKIYPMLEACKATKWQLQPKSRRGTKAVLLQRCRIRRAYSGGKGTVAGYPACYLASTEIDKWTGDKSTEADAFESFQQRASGYPLESKSMAESTPSTLGQSRVWKLLTAPTTDRWRFYVPCPHCHEFQILEWGTKETTFGVKWRKPSTGKTDIDLAETSAYYQCRHCQGKILDSDRHVMIRRGEWLSDGESIDKHRKITGKPRVKSKTVALGPLPTLYSLLIKGWGQLVRQFIECGRDPEKLRNFWNSVLAEIWDPKPKAIEPHEVAARLIDHTTARKLVPEWAIFLTRGIDVQQDGTLFVWIVIAWGPGGRGHVVDYGVTDGTKEIQEVCKNQVYQHADGGPAMRPTLTIIDSSDATDAVYALCRVWKGLGLILPSKGSSTSDFVETFKPSRLEEDGKATTVRAKVKRGDLVLIIINVKVTNKWFRGHLQGEYEGTEVAAFTLTPDTALDLDFLSQLTNEYEDEAGNWKKLGVNDFRDGIRMAYVAKQYITNHGKHDDALPARPTIEQRSAAVAKRARKPNPYTEGSGRWHET